MYERVGLLGLAQSVAQHASDRQNIIAQNVANADTPGYKARDLTPFKIDATNAFEMRRTSDLHLSSPADQNMAWRTFEVVAQSDPNGNSVNLEDEVLRAVDAGRAHNRAVTIYQTSLQILRSSIGR